MVVALAFADAIFASPVPARKPKLVVGIVVDQFRYDYLVKYKSEYNSGLARLLERGAVFTNGHQAHFPTVTAVGHATFFTGATPSVSGIVGNDWFDRGDGKKVTSVADFKEKTLGAESREAASPRRLLASTVGDELKASGKGGKVIGISIKDRSAILPAGHSADGAYWFDNNTGNWVSSTYYFPELPEWVRKINGGRPADKYAGAAWKPVIGGADFAPMPSEKGRKLYSQLEKSPFGNELIEEFAEQAIAAERLGQGYGTDVLTVSFSANDYVGHEVGPDDPKVHDMCVRTDRLLGKFFQYLDSKVGMGNVLVVLTADHGVAPTPEANAARHMPGGRLEAKKIQETIEAALTARFGEGAWIVGAASFGSLYLNEKLLQDKKLDGAEVRTVAARAAGNISRISRVYTKDQLLGGLGLQDEISRRVARGFHAARGADLFIIPDAYWFYSEAAGGTTHGSPYGYDSHVPIIFMGGGVKHGSYHRTVAVNDIAPTLAALLEIETPSGSEGRIQDEIF